MSPANLENEQFRTFDAKFNLASLIFRTSLKSPLHSLFGKEKGEGWIEKM